MQWHETQKIKNISKTNMTPPNSCKEFLRFVGLINYYINVWERHSHMLSHLTELMFSKVKCKWAEVKKRAFK